MAPSQNLPDETQPLVGYAAATVESQPHIIAYIPTVLLQRPAILRRYRYRDSNTPSSYVGLSLLTLAFLFVFFTWPRTVEISVVDLNLGKIHFNIKKGDSFIPQVFLDMDLRLKLEARNPNYFGVTYDTLNVGILFEDDEIGQVQSRGTDIKALGTSYIDATLDLSGLRIASNVLALLADVATGNVHLRAATSVTGRVNMFGLQFPLKGKVMCNLLVNTQDQIILTQDCYV